MNWLTNFSFILLLIYLQLNHVEPKSHHHGSRRSSSPWDNQTKAQTFVKCMIKKISSLPVFPKREKKDMEDIVETMMSAFKSIKSSKASSFSKMKAINYAFASSIAELAITIDVNYPKSIKAKTKALKNALKQCLKSTVGTVNRRFITEIKNLICMFSKEAEASDDSSEYEVIEGDYDDIMSEKSQSYLVLENNDNNNATAKLLRLLLKGLLKSDVFKAIYDKNISEQVAINASDSALKLVASNLGLNQSIVSQIKSEIIQSLSNLSTNHNSKSIANLRQNTSSISKAYATVIAKNIATILGSKFKINYENVYQVAAIIADAYIRGSNMTASKLGLKLRNIDVYTDLQKVQSFILSGGSNYSSMQEIKSINITYTYPGKSDAYVLHNISIDGISRRLSDILTSSFLVSKVFIATFNNKTSKAISIEILKNIAASIADNFKLKKSARLVNALVKAIMKASDTRQYAQAIANATATALVANVQLSTDDLNKLAIKLVSDFLQGVSSNARRFKINLSNINIQEDLSNAIRNIKEIIQNGAFLDNPSSDATYTIVLEYAHPGEDATISLSMDLKVSSFNPKDGDIIYKLIQTLLNIFIRSKTFKSIFNRDTPQPTLLTLTNAALQFTAENMKLNEDIVLQMKNRITQSLSTINNSSDTSVYAMIIAANIAAALGSSFADNNNISDIGATIASNFITKSAIIARKIGIELENINADQQKFQSLIPSDSARDSSGIEIASPNDELKILESFITVELTRRLSDALTFVLLNSKVFSAVFNDKTPKDMPSLVLMHALKNLTTQITTDFILDNSAAQMLENALHRSVFSITIGCDTWHYAQAIANSTAAVLTANHHISAFDLKSKAGKLVSAIWQGVFSDASSFGVDLSGINTQEDFSNTINNVKIVIQSNPALFNLKTQRELTRRLSNALTLAFLNSKVFSAIFNDTTPKGIVINAIKNLSNQIAIGFRLGNNTAQIVENALFITVSISRRSDTRQYAQAIANSTARVLIAYRRITAFDLKNKAGKLVSAVLQGISSNVSGFGIDLSDINTREDLSNAIKDVEITIQSYPPLDYSLLDTPYDVDFQLEYMDGDALSLGSNSSINYRDGDATHYLLQKLFIFFLRSHTFRMIFNHNVSRQNVLLVSKTALETVAASLRLKETMVSPMKNQLTQSFAELRNGSDTNAYAMVIAKNIATFLGSRYRINYENINPIGAKLASAFLRGSAGMALKLGFNLKNVDVDADIENLQTYLFSDASIGVLISYFENLKENKSDGTRPNILLPSAIRRLTLRPLETSFSNSKVFRTVFNNRTSIEVVNSIFEKIADAIAKNLKLDNSATTILIKALTTATKSDKIESKTIDYAYTIAKAITDVLLTNSKISGFDLIRKVQKILSVFLQGAYSYAPKFGIDLSGINVQEDLKNATRTIEITIQINPAPDYLYLNDPYDVDLELAYPDDEGDYVQGSDLFLDSSTVRRIYVRSLTYSFSKSQVFRTVFNNKTSKEAADNVFKILADAIALNIRLDNSTTMQLVKATNATTIEKGFGTRKYARAISNAIVDALIASNENSGFHLKRKVHKLVSEFLQRVSSYAPTLGINLSGISVKDDLSNTIQNIEITRRFSDAPLDLISEYLEGLKEHFLGATGHNASEPSVDHRITLRSIAYSFSKSKVFSVVFNNRTSNEVANNIFKNLADTISITLKLDNRTTTTLIKALTNITTSVKIGSDTREYAQAIANAIADALITSSKMADFNLNRKVQKLVSVFLQGVYSYAPKHGIDLSGINMKDDLSNATLSIDEIFELSDDHSELTSVYFRGLKGHFTGTHGRKAFQPYVVHIITLKSLVYSFLNSRVFSTIFNERTSNEVAINIFKNLAETISTTFKLNNSTTTTLTEALTNITTSHKMGSDTRGYAQAIANAIADVLITSSKISGFNLKRKVQKLVSVLLQSVYSSAPRHGIDLSGINVKDDLSDAIENIKETLKFSELISEYLKGLKGFFPSRTELGTFEPSVIHTIILKPLTYSFSQSKMFRTVFNNMTSKEVANNILRNLADIIVENFKLSNSATTMLIKSFTTITNSSEIEASDYAYAIANAIADALIASRELSGFNLKRKVEELVVVFLEGVYSYAPRFGIDLSGLNVKEDLSNAIWNIKVTMQNDPYLHYSTPYVTYTVDLESSDSKKDHDINLGTYLKPSSLVSRDGDATLNLLRKLLSYFKQSQTFRIIFNRNTSTQNALFVTNSALQSVSETLGLKANVVSRLKNKIAQSLYKVRNDSDTNVYAKVIAINIAAFLGRRFEINYENVNYIGANIASTFVKELAISALKVGLNLQTVDVDADIENLQTLIFLGVSSKSQTATFDVGLKGYYTDDLGSYEFEPFTVRQIILRPLTSSFSKSKVFSTIFNSRTSKEVANNIFKNLTDTIAVNFRLDNSTTARLIKALTTAIKIGSDTRDYASAIANATADVLIINSKKTGFNIEKKVQELVSVFLKGLSSYAPKIGINLSGINIKDDLSSAIKFIFLPFHRNSTLDNLNPRLYFDARNPGGFRSIAVDLDDSLLNFTYEDSSLKLMETFLNILLRSDNFNNLFHRRDYPRVLLVVFNSAVQSVASSLNLNSSTVSQLENRINQSLSSVRPQSDTSAYATIIATHIATVLDNNGKLNNENAYEIGVVFANAMINGLSLIAPILNDTHADGDGGSDQLSIILTGSTDALRTVIIPLNTDLEESYSSGITEDLISLITSSLSNSKVFKAAFNNKTSKSIVFNFSRVLSEAKVIDSIIEKSTKTKLRNAIVSALSKVEIGSDTRHYAMAISNATIEVLAATGKTTNSDLVLKALKLVSIIVQRISSSARRFGINISGIRVYDDLLNAFKDIVVKIRYNSSRRKSGPDYEYPTKDGSMFPSLILRIPFFVYTDGNVTSKLLQSLLNVLQSSDSFKAIFNRDDFQQVLRVVYNSGLQSVATSLGLNGLTISKLENKIIQALSAIHNGSNPSAYIITIATNIAEILGKSGKVNDGNVYQIAAEIASAIIERSALIAPGRLQLLVPPSKETIRLSTLLTSSLSSSKVFSAAFNTTMFKGVTTYLTKNLTDSIVANFGLNSSAAANLTKAITSAVSKLGTESKATDYAQAIANATSEVLVDNGQISDSNLVNNALKIVLVFLRAIYFNAPKYRINLSGINVEEELSNVRKIIGLDIQSSLSSGEYISNSPGTDSGYLAKNGFNFPDLGLSFKVSAGKTPGEMQPLDLLMKTLVHSPNGLKSPEAAVRINKIVLSIVQSIGQNGLDIDNFFTDLKNNIFQLANSGLPTCEMTVEALMEVIVGLVQVLESAKISKVDTSSSSKIINSAVESLSVTSDTNKTKLAEKLRPAGY